MKAASVFLRLLHIQVHLRQDFIMKATAINTDQTATMELSDLGP